MKRAALYVRVSSLEQKKHGLSVDTQITALREYCKQNDLIEVGLYNDAGISARKSYKKRPALLQMISDCQAGKIDLVIFTKLDRFFRSVPDYYACVEQMNRVPWRAIWEDYETETSSGIFKVNIMLSVAQSEADRTSERVRSAYDYKRAKGQYIGSVPIGYKLDRDCHPVVDPATHDAVAMLFRHYLDGDSLKVAHQLAKEAGLPIKRTQSYNLLHNPIYAGNSPVGACYAYITPEEHEKIARRLQDSYRVPHWSNRPVYKLQGLVYCGYCGHMMSSCILSHRTVRGRYERIVLRCQVGIDQWRPGRCIGINVNEAIIEEYLLEHIDALVKEYNVEVKIHSASAELRQSQAKIKALESKLKRIGVRYEDGDIDLDEYRAKRTEIKKEMEALTEAATPREPKELPANWRELYDTLTPENQRIFWHRIIKRIEVRKNHDIKVYI